MRGPMIFLILSVAFFSSGSARADDLLSLSQDPKQWVMPARDYASTRFSPLDQINASNVGKMQAAWMFSVGTQHGQEAAPLIVGDTLYVVSSYPNKVFALDSTTGDLKWTYIPNQNRAAQGVACCDVVTRGIAYDSGKIFLVTLDNHVVALDAKTGREQWATKTGEINLGETTTAAPYVVKGKVFVGISGGELGVRGRVTVLDENSGKIDYVAYSTGPDNDVRLGPDFKPFYDFMKGKDLGVSTWPPDAWKIGGGTMWGWFSRSRPQPRLLWDLQSRSLELEFSVLATTFGRQPYLRAIRKAGKRIGPTNSIRTIFGTTTKSRKTCWSSDLGGKTRKVMIHPGRNGFMYVIDRQPERCCPPTRMNLDDGLQGRRPQDRPDHPESGPQARPEPYRPQRLPGLSRRQGLAADRMVSPNEASLRSPSAPLHGSSDFRRRIYRRDSRRRSDGRHVRRTGRLSRRIHGLGPCPAKEGVVDQGKHAGVERRARNRGRCRLLRDDGSAVQSRRREKRRRALAVPSRVRDHRAAGDQNGFRRPAICRDF